MTPTFRDTGPCVLTAHSDMSNTHFRGRAGLVCQRSTKKWGEGETHGHRALRADSPLKCGVRDEGDTVSVAQEPCVHVGRSPAAAVLE